MVRRLQSVDLVSWSLHCLCVYGGRRRGSLEMRIQTLFVEAVAQHLRVNNNYRLAH